jgi:hypothetical protein
MRLAPAFGAHRSSSAGPGGQAAAISAGLSVRIWLIRDSHDATSDSFLDDAADMLRVGHPVRIASKRPAYGSAGLGHPLLQMGRPSGNGRRYFGQAQAILACRDLLLSDLATRWIADGNPRAGAVGVFPRELTIWLSRGSPY